MKAKKTFAVVGLLLTLAAGNALATRADDQPAPTPNPPAPDSPTPTPAAPVPAPAPAPAPAAPGNPAPDAPPAPTPAPAAPAPNAPATPTTPAPSPTPAAPALPPPDAPAAPVPAESPAPAPTAVVAPTPAPVAPVTLAPYAPAVPKKATQQQLAGRIVAIDRSHMTVTLQVENLTYVLEIVDATRITDEGRERNMNDLIVGRYIIATIMVRELTEGRVEVGVLSVDVGKAAEAQGRAARKRK